MEIYTYSKADLMLSSKIVESANFVWFSVNDKQRYDKEMFLTLQINLPHAWVEKIPRESALVILDRGYMWEPQTLTIDVLKLLTRADKFFKLLWHKDYNSLDSFDCLGKFIVTNVFEKHAAIKIVMPIKDNIIARLLNYIATAAIYDAAMEDPYHVGQTVRMNKKDHEDRRSCYIMINMFHDMINTAYSWTTPFTAKDMREYPFHTVLRTASDLWPKYRLNGEVSTADVPINYYEPQSNSKYVLNKSLEDLTHSERLRLYSEVYAYKDRHEEYSDQWPIYNTTHPLFKMYDIEKIDDDDCDDDEWYCPFDDCCD